MVGDGAFGDVFGDAFVAFQAVFDSVNPVSVVVVLVAVEVDGHFWLLFGVVVSSDGGALGLLIFVFIR